MEIILFAIGVLIGAAIIFLLKSSTNNNLEQATKIKALDEQIQKLLIYQGRFEQAQITINDLKLQNQRQQQEFFKESEQQNNKIIHFEKQNELLKQNQQNLQLEKQEWTREKEKILFQLSEELIRKNNEEQDKFGKNQEEKISKIIENLYKNFESVLNKVSSLDDDVKKSSQDINLTKNALLNPSGVGRSAEITLENILKSSGLKEKSTLTDTGDYILQSHFVAEDKSARKPDALVFLPNDHLVIIDSKSSIYFLELQQAKEAGNKEQEMQVKVKLKETMRKHLDDLKKRNYAEAKEFDAIKQNNRHTFFTTIMFLQTEKMIEIVREVDEHFESRALESGIWVLTPIGLYNLLSHAKLVIDRIKQEKNIEVLRVEVKKLIESVATMFDKSKEIGKSINKTMKSYNDFASTFNTRFLVRVNNLNKMGIESDKKAISGKLEKYNVVSDEDIIEIEN